MHPPAHWETADAAHRHLPASDADASAPKARTAARARLEVDDLLLLRPDLGIPPKQAYELGIRLDAMHGNPIGSFRSVPPSRGCCRCRPPTSPSGRSAEQLYLSHHMVTSQGMSISCRFGVGSRSQAIQGARDLGLLRELELWPFRPVGMMSLPAGHVPLQRRNGSSRQLLGRGDDHRDTRGNPASAGAA